MSSVFPLAALAALCLLGMSQAKKRPGADNPCGMLVVRSEEDIAGLNERIEAMARAGGGQVYVPAGTYRVHEPIMLRDNVTIRGDGPGTVLLASERFDEFLRENKVYGSASDVSILFYPRDSHFGVLNVKGASGVRVYDLAMRGDRENVRAAAGLMISRAKDVLVRGVSATNCGGSGFNVLRSRDVTLSQLTSTHNHNGVIISGPGSVTQSISVTDCRIADNRWSGIYMCGDGAGADKAKNGPANLVIANNFVFRHMCDEGIKAFGVSDVIVTGNRVDYALEATISVRGQNVVIANNICSHGDDGMNNKGNGVAIHYGNRGSDRINAVIQGNICAECNSGIWSEGFQTVKGKAQPLGRVAIVGNVCVDNVTAGIGHIMKSDLTCVGTYAWTTATPSPTRSPLPKTTWASSSEAVPAAPC